MAYYCLDPKDRQIEDRFFDKVLMNDEGDWVWIGYKDPNGYGRMNVNSNAQWAHRISYKLFKGEIPEGLQIDHLCRNPSCVNPNHLEPVTNRENGYRGNSKIHWTRCIHGHVLKGENLLIRKSNGTRVCRECFLFRARWGDRARREN